MFETGQTLERVVEEQGFSREEFEALDPLDPVLLTVASTLPYVPQYLDLIEEWLTNLP
jgi:hypothetical protein